MLAPRAIAKLAPTLAIVKVLFPCFAVPALYYQPTYQGADP
jgi:hypothetical protein